MKVLKYIPCHVKKEVKSEQKSYEKRIPIRVINLTEEDVNESYIKEVVETVYHVLSSIMNDKEDI